LLSGLWHGANWTYVIWGFLHAVYLIVEKILKKVADKLFKPDKIKIPGFIQTLFTFTLVTFAWIFFRASSVNQAFSIINLIFSDITNLTSYQGLHHSLSSMSINEMTHSIKHIGLTGFEIISIILAVLVMEIVHILQRKGSVREMVSRMPVIARHSLYYLLLMSILILSANSAERFIYFQF
jgi:hypothetical protein